jgi:7-cyano-7-deazaguanine reductase
VIRIESGFEKTFIMINHNQNPLGQTTIYPSQYSPQLLFSIPRTESRQSLGLVDNELPFYGGDLWTAYETSWLNPKGKPQVALAEFWIPAQSKNIIESKSFKLYLNSFNQSRFESVDQVKNLMQKDLSAASAVDVSVKLFSLDHPQLMTIEQPDGINLDDLDISVDQYHPHPDLLRVNHELVKETVFSNLLKTNCPVTGQPDWASLVIEYSGKKINHSALLAYIVSFREHQDFHEHCVERIFCDLLNRCKPERLTVYARYTRRGGLDINPFRSTEKDFHVKSRRMIRQ